MIKRIFILLFLLLITAYLIVAVTVFNTKPADQTCKGMELIINDSIDHGFITQKEVLRLLNSKKLSPIGKKMGDINTRLLEDELSKHPLIENVECYRTPGRKIGIEVTQRLPLLRVMAANGDNYYIDSKGKVMPIPNSSAHVAVVTGSVDRDFATKELYKLGIFLQNHPLWEAQIEQINVTPAKELELVPRVGEHIIFLGKPGDYEEKFANLRTFFGYMMAHPGKKLLFMGQDFGQFIEWDEKKQLDWMLLGYDKHRELQGYVKDLNHFYRETPALWQVDYSWEGFQWIVPDDSKQSVIAFLRRDAAGKMLLVVCNFNPVLRKDYQMGVPNPGSYKEILNSDDKKYGGSGVTNGTVKSEKGPMHGFDQHISLTLPPMSTLYLSVPAARKPRTKKVDAADEKAAKPTKPAAKKATKATAKAAAPAAPAKTEAAPKRRGRPPKAKTTV